MDQIWRINNQDFLRKYNVSEQDIDKKDQKHILRSLENWKNKEQFCFFQLLIIYQDASLANLESKHGKKVCNKYYKLFWKRWINKKTAVSSRRGSRGNEEKAAPEREVVSGNKRASPQRSEATEALI